MADELYRDVEWSHVVRLPVLGVMVTFATNSASVFDAIHETYGAWAGLDGDIVSPSGATVRIVVHDRPAAPETPPAFSSRVPDPTRLLIIWDGGMGVSDTTRLESLAYVTEGLVARRAEFADGVLEPLTLFLLGALDRQPLHAAAVARGEAAILLAAPSGTGKSTLSYAACRRGFSLLADEPVYVQMRPGLRVWGRRSRVHLPVEARAHFPELHDVAPTRLPSGKTKMVIDVRTGERRYADHAGICLLRRGRGTEPALERVPSEQVVAELGHDLDQGFDLFADTIGERIAEIAGRGAWRLSMAGGAPEDAVPLLEDVAAELEGEG